MPKKLRLTKLLSATMLLMILWHSISCNSHSSPAALEVSADSSWIQEIELYRKNMDQEFRNPESSPLDSAAVFSFEGLPWYPINPAYKVKAKLNRLENQPVFELPHSHGRTYPYRNFAVAVFELEGKTCELVILKPERTDRPELANYLFLPFTDESNGKETYGAGRYLDMEMTDAAEIELDFNKAYNPYCAYNNKYFCPIPPASNHIPLAVKAGVKYDNSLHP